MMKLIYILKYFLLITISFNLYSIENDSTEILHHQSRGIRIGIDLLKPIASISNKNYLSYEISIDSRVWKNFFIPIEYGYEKRLLDFITYEMNIDGSYFKTGFDYSFLGALYTRDDILSMGMRFAYANYDLSIPHIIITDDYWGSSLEGSLEEKSMSSYWLELVLGLKAEIIWNIFLGGSVRYSIYLGGSDYKGMSPPAHIPGFGEVFTGRNIQLTYGIFYMIPFHW